MKRHDFLGGLHGIYQPRTYCEIGVYVGGSLALSRVPSVAIDPNFRIMHEVHCDLQLVRETSDDFFARESPFDHLPGGVVDLAFIDGMHLFEFALRDFMNLERHSAWSSVVVFDDMLPRNVDEAARDRHTKDWTGDVYKLIPVLQRYRPDLEVVPLDTQPTGLLMVLGLNPADRTLSEHYDEIITTYVVDDPQQVPEPVLDRSCAVSPELALEASFWPDLVAGRSGQASYDRADLRDGVEEYLALSARGTLADWRPDGVRQDMASAVTSG
ncbi:class I SAM-dependent methyltransferase [Actinopolymorpha sp. B11F2]|uniref:class I SAM-dependent methyltransferase n=1 Tax=Actinopolymorpha sp. B11F2 TaxID=3160862 RepID=UPI0032E3DABA